MAMVELEVVWPKNVGKILINLDRVLYIRAAHDTRVVDEDAVIIQFPSERVYVKGPYEEVRRFITINELANRKGGTYVR